LGTALSIIIVEAGLLSSLSFPFIALPLYNVYLGIRNVFNSEKIKNQSKVYDQCQRVLMTLKKLALKKEILLAKRDIQLASAINSFLPTLSFQEKATFSELSLKDQIKRFKQQMNSHPAYLRKQKEKQIWDKIFRYSAIFSCIGITLSAITLLMIQMLSYSIFLAPILSVGVIGVSIGLGLIFLGPVLLSTFGYPIYWRMRHSFSEVKAKAEHRHYSTLKKNITELEKLEKQLNQLDTKIDDALQLSVESLTQVNHALKQEKDNVDVLKNDPLHVVKFDNGMNHYGPLFSLSTLAHPTKQVDYTTAMPRPS
ncbi:hypothetical protein, partial [Rickettsiella grylli]|uniref:hypothetical protein n=1 Tax=Rickettsiella grylli TaxID=59196 RepID=UPI000AECB4BB